MVKRRARRGRLAVLVAAALAVVLASCGKDDGPTEVGARRAATAFLANSKKAKVDALCAGFTHALLVRLAPPTGDCRAALVALTALTGRGDESTLPTKRVDSVSLHDDVAIVVLTDRITDENELPLRFVFRDGRWYLDELGPGVRISQACIDERAAVEQAVDDYLSAKSTYPPDAKALVPGYLPKLPDNHAVGPDGKVLDTGVCA